MASIDSAELPGFVRWLQLFAAVAGTANFGGSVLQSPLIVPMLQMPQVPVYYGAQQMAYLLTNSEYFFPPTNAACALANLTSALVTSFSSSSSSLGASSLSSTIQHRRQLPFLYVAFAANVATTIYTVLFMIPLNKKQKAIAAEMVSDEIAAQQKNSVDGVATGTTMASATGGGTKDGGSVDSKKTILATELRSLQKRWILRNYGRNFFIALSGVAAIMGLAHSNF